jgi:transcriptional regulator with XRE-family HTH domain
MAREYARMSQETAAGLLGLKAQSKSTLSKWENGTQDPRARVVARMAAIYGVPVELLINPPPEANEVIERRLSMAVRDAEALEREDWERGAGPGPAAVGGRGAERRRRSA